LPVSVAKEPYAHALDDIGGIAKFLCSSGISNPSIHDALVDLLGKPIAESNALSIPTGSQPFPGGPAHVYRFISGATRIDDQTAIKVTDGTVDVVSEGRWRQLASSESRS